MINMNIKFEVSDHPLRRYESNIKLLNLGWFGVRSPAMSPFDRAHTTSYLTLIEIMHLYCTVFEL